MKKIILMAAFILSACSADTLVVADPEPISPAALMREMTVVPSHDFIHQPAQIENLMGLSPSDVILRMGSPNLVRRDGLGQVMLFEHEACVLDVVFFAETIEAPYSVEHISSRTPLGQKFDIQECLIRLKPDGFGSIIANSK